VAIVVSRSGETAGAGSFVWRVLGLARMRNPLVQSWRGEVSGIGCGVGGFGDEDGCGWSVIFWSCDCVIDVQEGSSQNLARHVEEEARDLGGEAFTRFMDSLYERIHALAESSEVSDNLAAVRAIDELIDVQLGEIATKIAKFASYLRSIFESKTDSDVLVNASKALGHLAATGGALTADVVEYQVNCPPLQLHWLP
jgi:hypothetical protein